MALYGSADTVFCVQPSAPFIALVLSSLQVGTVVELCLLELSNDVPWNPHFKQHPSRYFLERRSTLGRNVEKVSINKTCAVDIYGANPLQIWKLVAFRRGYSPAVLVQEISGSQPSKRERYASI